MARALCCWLRLTAGRRICERFRCHSMGILPVRVSMIIIRYSILLLGILSGCASKSHPTIVLSHGVPESVVVEGVEPQLNSILQVRVADAPPSAPPLVGEITRKNNTLIFTPRYPFQTGLKYIATLSPQNITTE